MSNKLKTIVYLTPTELNTLIGGTSIIIGGVTIDANNLSAYDIRVKFSNTDIAPVQGIKLGTTKQTPDANGDVTIPLASGNTYGLTTASANYGTLITGSNQIGISKATDTEIENKTQYYKPIVPANLDKAISVGIKTAPEYTSYQVELSDGSTRVLKIYSELI